MRADDRQRRADHIAHEGHQDADGNERTGVGAGEDRRGGCTADVGERGHARGEEVELEELADDEHQHRVDAEDNEAGGDPGGSLTELEQARAGGQQADDGVEQEVGDLAGAGDLAERGDGGDQGDDGDEQNGPGRFIGEVGQRIELVADVGGDGADKERGAEQEDQTLEGDGLGVELRLFLQTGGDLVELAGVSLGPLVELGGELNDPQQEHDPEGKVDRVNDQRVAHVGLTDIERSLNGDHVAAAADPAAAESAKAHPGVGADRSLHQHERADKADHDGEGGAEEADEHLRAELEDLTDVAAEQHREDHRVGEVVFQSGVCGLGLGHIPHAQRAQEHGDEVAENDRRNVLEEFLHAALGAFLQRDENGCHKEQHRHM